MCVKFHWTRTCFYTICGCLHTTELRAPNRNCVVHKDYSFDHLALCGKSADPWWGKAMEGWQEREAEDKQRLLQELRWGMVTAQTSVEKWLDAGSILKDENAAFPGLVWDDYKVLVLAWEAGKPWSPWTDEDTVAQPEYGGYGTPGLEIGRPRFLPFGIPIYNWRVWARPLRSFLVLKF